jgi:hypothetical protein
MSKPHLVRSTRESCRCTYRKQGHPDQRGQIFFGRIGRKAAFRNLNCTNLGASKLPLQRIR